MPNEQWRGLVRSGQAVIAPDTNAVRGKKPTAVRKLITIAKLVNRLRGVGLDNKVFIPALVHFEMIHQLHRHYGENFEYDQIVGALKNLEIEILPFDELSARNAGSQLASWYPNEESWREAKRPSGGRATLDWAIAAQAQADHWLLVSNDTAGGEFDHVREQGRCASFEHLSELLAELCRKHDLPAD
jgi:hypothetical protein